MEADFDKANATSTARSVHHGPRVVSPTLLSIETFSRTQCRACHLISTDIQSKLPLLNKPVSVREFLEDGYCESLGYFYQPYNWLETTCDLMIEEEIGDAFSIHMYILISNVNPLCVYYRYTPSFY